MINLTVDTDEATTYMQQKLSNTSPTKDARTPE
jgi:hypothetical protein